MPWIVSVPVWGDFYRDVFLTRAWPALRYAIEHLDAPVKLLIHTDDDTQLATSLNTRHPQFSLEFRPISADSKYVALQNSHADAINRAKIGDNVVLLNADLVVSGNLLTRCDEHLKAGKEAVVLVGVRTVLGPELPPVGALPRALLEWAWAHRHQIIKDLEWGKGKSALPTNIFFIKGDSVICRAFHQHPVAIKKTQEIAFKSTIDGDLLESFPQELLHVVIDPDDLSMLEMSDPSRSFGTTPNTMTPAFVAQIMRTRASPLHRWLFQQRVVIKGPLEGDDEKVAHDTLVELHKRGPLPLTRREELRQHKRIR